MKHVKRVYSVRYRGFKMPDGEIVRVFGADPEPTDGVKMWDQKVFKHVTVEVVQVFGTDLEPMWEHRITQHHTVEDWAEPVSS
jgi:hypothetical protein